MGASSYMRDRKRIYVEAEGRGRGWKKAALKRLNKDYGAEIIERDGKVVGVKMRNSGLIVCKKKAFESKDAALDSIEQIHKYFDTGHEKPVRVYECRYCRKFHTTRSTSPGQPADFDDE